MKLLGFQRAGVAFLVKNRRALLADPMGTGKTAQLIRTLQVLQEMDEQPFPALVVCPNSLKASTWQNELTAWAPELSVQVVDGNATQRRKQLASGADVTVINWEAVRLHSKLAGYGTIALTEKEKLPKELNEVGFRTVIADEFHKAKEPKAAQTRALWAVMHQAEFRYGMTGTPIAQNIGDLWSLLHGIEDAWFPARTKYLDYFCTPPDSPVLMADGTFAPIGDLQVGAMVLGFSRERQPYGVPLVATEVTAVNRRHAELVRVHMSSGKEFVCTPDHQWLDGRAYLLNKERPQGRSASIAWSTPELWPICSCGKSIHPGNVRRHLVSSGHLLVREALPIPEALKPEPYEKIRRDKYLEFRSPFVGMKMVKIVTVPPPLAADQERIAAWLGGIYDGEGSLLFIAQSRTANPDIYEAIENAIVNLGFRYSASAKGFNLLGGSDTLVRFLHYCRPVKRETMMSGERYRGLSTLLGKSRHASDQIVSIEDAGSGEVVSLTTTVGTYVVHGYASSNCETSLNQFGGLDVHGLNHQHRDEFFKIVDPLMRRIPKEAALPQLPPVLPDQIRHTHMSAKQEKAYRQMEKDMIVLLNDILVAPNPLAQLMRLNQFAAAHATVNEDGSLSLANPSAKVDDLVELLEEMGEEPLVVAAVSRQLIELASDRLTRLGISHGLVTGAQSIFERQEAVRRFQAGYLRVVLLTLGAGAEGITLTRASTMCFMQTPYSNIQYLQARDRVHRIGSEQHDCIRIIKQITPDTIEERREELLAVKEMRMEEVVRDRETLAKLLGAAA